MSDNSSQSMSDISSDEEEEYVATSTTAQNNIYFLSTLDHDHYRTECLRMCNLSYRPNVILDCRKIIDESSLEKTIVIHANSFAGGRLICNVKKGIPKDTIVGELFGHIMTKKANDAIEKGFEKLPEDGRAYVGAPRYRNYFTHNLCGTIFIHHSIMNYFV